MTGLIVAAIAAAEAAGTLPAEFEDLTFTDSTTHVTVTGNSDGTPFTQTSSASGGTATNTTATTTTATGPNHFDNAENWSGGAIPSASDIVIIDNIETEILYGLDALSGITLAEFHLRSGFEGSRFGLKPVNPAGYFEYRQRAVTIKATKAFIGEGEGAGCPFANIDFSTVQTELIVYNTGRSDDNKTPALCVVGTNASNVMRFLRGNWGIAVFPGDVATAATLQIGYINDRENDSTGYIGAGTTLTTIQISGGVTTIELVAAAATTFSASGGTVVINGTANIGATSFVVTGDAEVFFNTTGTLGGAPVLADQARLDFSQDMRAKTITNPIEVQSAEVIVNDPFQVVSNLRLDYNYAAVRVNGCDLGTNVRVTRGTPA